MKIKGARPASTSGWCPACPSFHGSSPEVDAGQTRLNFQLVGRLRGDFPEVPEWRLVPRNGPILPWRCPKRRKWKPDALHQLRGSAPCPGIGYSSCFVHGERKFPSQGLVRMCQNGENDARIAKSRLGDVEHVENGAGFAPYPLRARNRGSRDMQGIIPKWMRGEPEFISVFWTRPGRDRATLEY